MSRKSQLVFFGAVVILWFGALVYSAVSSRVLFADGARFVHVLMLSPLRFYDYDFQRTFASLITQAPVLFGQRIGLESVAEYAALYATGVSIVPACLYTAALYICRRQPIVLTTTLFGLIVFGFSVNFINSEVNLFFGLVWFSIAILSVNGKARLLRGLALPLAAIVLLRVYEGMLLVGPPLAAWALVASTRDKDPLSRFGLMLSALLFISGSIIGIGGVVSPRDPGNAAGFLTSTAKFFSGPHVWLLLSTLSAVIGVFCHKLSTRIVFSVSAGILGAIYLYKIVSLEGFYSFVVYYENRAFLTFALPVVVAALFLIYFRGPTLRILDSGLVSPVWVLLPFSFGIVADVVGTVRWNDYVRSFCNVLSQPISPGERFQGLKASGVRTGWGWTQPTMSVLLRVRGSSALVENEEGAYGWQPAEPFDSSRNGFLGLCQAPLFSPESPDSYEREVDFTGAAFPSYLTSVEGMSTAESWATWTEGRLVEFRFAQPLPESFELSLKVAAAFGRNKYEPITVEAGRRRVEFRVAHEPVDIVLQFKEVGQADTIRIRIPAPESPMSLGMSDDRRQLGLAFVAMRINPK